MASTRLLFTGGAILDGVSPRKGAGAAAVGSSNDDAAATPKDDGRVVLG